MKAPRKNIGTEAQAKRHYQPCRLRCLPVIAVLGLAVALSMPAWGTEPQAKSGCQRGLAKLAQLSQVRSSWTKLARSLRACLLKLKHAYPTRLWPGK